MKMFENEYSAGGDDDILDKTPSMSHKRKKNSVSVSQQQHEIDEDIIIISPTDSRNHVSDEIWMKVLQEEGQLSPEKYQTRSKIMFISRSRAMHTPSYQTRQPHCITRGIRNGRILQRRKLTVAGMSWNCYTLKIHGQR
jgi:hypothetical protein